MAQLELGERSVELVWENNLPSDVQMNRQRVQQVIFNLLINAFQALPEDGTVTFRAYQEKDDRIILRVTDNGPGISKDHLKRMFDPFFTTRSDGTGLGLWIAYRLVRSMNGQIEVQSTLGEGTSFQVLLPAHLDRELDKERRAAN
jgi:signal transduction histidine kinase